MHKMFLLMLLYNFVFKNLGFFITYWRNALYKIQILHYLHVHQKLQIDEHLLTCLKNKYECPPLILTILALMILHIQIIIFSQMMYFFQFLALVDTIPFKILKSSFKNKIRIKLNFNNKK